MEAVQAAGEAMKTSDGYVARECARVAKRAVPPDQVRDTLIRTPLPTISAADQTLEDEEEYQGVSVSERTHTHETDFELLCKWAEETVNEQMFPRATSLKITPTGRAAKGCTTSIERHITTVIKNQKRIQELTRPRNARLKELREEVTGMEDVVSELLTRMGGACEYRVVLNGAECFATMFLTQPRTPKPRGPNITELRSIVYGSIHDAFQANAPALDVATATFEELSNAWERGVKLAAGDKVQDRLESGLVRDTGDTRRRVHLRRKGTN
jgi:hypothetical protein